LKSTWKGVKVISPFQSEGGDYALTIAKFFLHLNFLSYMDIKFPILPSLEYAFPKFSTLYNLKSFLAFVLHTL